MARLSDTYEATSISVEHRIIALCRNGLSSTPTLSPCHYLLAKFLASSRVEMRKYSPDSPVWTDEATTCLSFGLCPIHPEHQPVVYKNCIWFWEKKLKYGNIKHNLAKRSRRSTCDRPFDFSDDAEEGKQHARARIRELLTASDPYDGDSAQVVDVPCPHLSQSEPKLLCRLLIP